MTIKYCAARRSTAVRACISIHTLSITKPPSSRLYNACQRSMTAVSSMFKHEERLETNLNKVALPCSRTSKHGVEGHAETLGCWLHVDGYQRNCRRKVELEEVEKVGGKFGDSDWPALNRAYKIPCLCSGHLWTPGPGPILCCTPTVFVQQAADAHACACRLNVRDSWRELCERYDDVLDEFIHLRDVLWRSATGAHEFELST